MATLDWHAERSDLSDIALLDRAPESAGIDLAAVRRYRRDRVRAEMVAREIDAVLLSDPVNIRYATGTRNMQVFSQRNAPARYLLLTEHRSILFEFTGCEHLAAGYDTVDEVRPARTASFVAAGPEIAARERAWAAEMAALVSELCGAGATLGMERMNAGAALALAAEGLRLVDAQEPVEMARAIKSAEELKCVNASLRATEIAVGKLRAAIRPGQTETALWSVLHRSVIEQNGDYCETRLLNTGPRTNPWFQETAHRVIEQNELIALDTDVVGCHGYYSDFSRTFHAGPDRPTPAQRELYRLAHEQVQHNMGILKPGMSFRDYAERAWDIPAKYHANRYYLSAHGCGMTGEYPYLYHRGDFPDAGYDGEILPGMTICVESYIGAEGGSEGVKLEQQVLVTGTGIELLSRFPFEAALLEG
ncbi:Xaa-Pro peptidase family protein [Paralimibaculum aggregatum]|uniref:Xaa-Pro peptidase family protein n=1 Tax=Paralimibaculum aggregatum TaxID=3036245 RepID=A0ABQ6LR67_9RHOB|nr:Xaa-Pro peptidase family protein [Limibaculum sp. NKW23]GMG83425.1 Xaa-Pro peptidase family protein [Limibaculum sp. NKW23]